MLMTLAAYNAGPGNLHAFRALAKTMGLNPNLWFGNVEHAAARKVGVETVQYVGNIYKYYLAYRLVTLWVPSNCRIRNVSDLGYRLSHILVK